jgi:hypothetical protein
LVIVALALCGSATWLILHQRARITAASPSGMLQRLPAQNAIILFLDFDALRRGGIVQILSASKTAEEPEYQAFVQTTGFDYRRDLDLAAASFGPDAEFFVVKGRFDWKKLAVYAEAQGGQCAKGLCRMPGSTPERLISFFPLQSNLMALAVSTDAFAAARLQNSQDQSVQPLDPPRDPVWLSIPSESLKATEHLPAATGPFAAALASADKILLSLGPQDQQHDQQYEARLTVNCRSSADAIALAAQLQHVTSLLREMMSRENQKPNPKDLTGVLTAGVFAQAGKRVVGRWPLTPLFLESLAAGTL